MNSLQGQNESHVDFAGLLQHHIRTSLYSYGQLAQLSGVPKRTIVNWLDGTVKQPRHWQSVVRVAAALRQERAATEELLAAAALPDLQSLLEQAHGTQDCSLLEFWKGEIANSGAQLSCLHYYLEALSTDLAHLPAYFPRQAAFTFTTIYQDMRLRPVANSPLPDVFGYVQSLDGDPWPALRQKVTRAVILGQPGMGKTWLLKAEAIRVAQEAWSGERTGDPGLIPLFVRMTDLVAILSSQCGIEEIRTGIAGLAARLTPKLPEVKVATALVSLMEKIPERVLFLLDALDEVPDRDGLRNLARRVVLLLGSATPSRILLASRTISYASAPLARYLGEDVAEYEILPFTEREISRVMRAWFHDRPALLQQLQFVMRRTPAIARQATNPLLLSLICMLNETRGEEISGKRSGLYEPVLRLLLEGRWRSFDMQLPENRVHRKLRLLESIAWCFATYQQSWWEHLPGEVIEQAIERLPDARRLWVSWRSEWHTRYEGPLWELSEWDGILVKGYLPLDGAASAVPYSFLHRTFQEYLVARFLLRRYAEEGLEAAELQEFLSTKAAEPEWYLVLLFLGEQLPVPTNPYDTSSELKPLLYRLRDILLDTARDTTGQLAIVAAETMLNLDLSKIRPQLLDFLRQRLLTLMRNDLVNTVMRVHAAQLLATFGDPRLAVMDIDAIDFVSIPEGSFLMGSDPEVDEDAFGDEFPQQARYTTAFAISRYPISNAQFRVFLNDKEDGYYNPRYWPEAIALGHWQDGMILRHSPVNRADGAVDWQPIWAQEPNQPGWPNDLPNGPIMGISWYEARAFIRWLQERWCRNGLIPATTRLDLPSEIEWEKAARGIDGRVYPWGNDFDGNRLNWFGHMLMAPAPIGAFPNSASPYGVDGMVGNLWEWTRSIFEPYDGHYQSGTDFADSVSPDTNLVVRGGAYFSVRALCRYAARLATLPNGRMNATFRIVKYET